MMTETALRRALGADYPLIFLPETVSTNDLAKKLAREGAPHGTAVLAAAQTGGRGRLGRSFLSPAGGIYLSVILRPVGFASELRHLTLLFAEAALRAVSLCAGVTPQIKWPNDLLLNGKKLAGILTEGALAQNGTYAWLVCGIGLNLNTVPPQVADIAAALSLADGAPLAAELIRRITDACDNALSQRDARLRAVRESCISLGKTVEIHDGGTPYRAFARELLSDGSLLVTAEDGTERTVFSGELLPPRERS